jgi:hypothetical protein
LHAWFAPGYAVKNQAGAYATDISPYQTEVSRYDLMIRLFNRYSDANYARLEWYVAFTEKDGFEFTKVKPSIYMSPVNTPINALQVGPNLMRAGAAP